MECGSISLELLLDKGAAVSLLNSGVWKGIHNMKSHIVPMEQNKVGVNGTWLSGRGICLLVWYRD